MKKRLLSVLLIATLAVGMMACGGSSDTEESTTTEETTEAESDEEKEVPETSTIKWARGLSGNILVTIAQKEGYFEDAGLTVEEIPLDPGGLAGVIQGQVDVASNFGTSYPIQYIAAGDDMAIIGGFMMEGCVPIIAKTGTEWNGVESFVGEKVGGTVSYYAGSALLEKGYDPKTAVEWQLYNSDADRLAAVVNGEIKYGILGTSSNYMAENTDGIEIVGYADEITPYYSCCRMVARQSWVEENPTTVKLLLEALLRAQCYFEANRDECTQILADELETDYDYVKAYMEEEEHYEINVATLHDIIVDNWEFMQDQELIDSSLDDSLIEERIHEEIYKAALESCVEKYHDEDPDFWDKMVEFCEEVE